MKTVIEMAQEAGLPEIIDNTNIPWAELSIFAVFIRDDEREANAKMVDHILKEGGGTWGDAIRARGNT
jgi:ABC-type sugar transport system substrate-binding protein